MQNAIARILCVGLIGGYMFGCVGAIEAEPPNTDRPNIILFLADDMGWGDPQCYQPTSKIPTPHIDRLAAQGMRFTDAHSPAAICTPSRYSILTGRYHWRSRLKGGIVWFWDQPLILPQRLTMGRMLQQRGYATACIGKWHLGEDWPLTDGTYISDHTDRVLLSGDKRKEYGRKIDYTRPIKDGPNERGFDYYFGTSVPNFPPYCFIENNRTVGIPTLEKPREMFGRGWGPMIEGWKLEKILPTLTEKAVRWIDQHVKQNKDKPFFLYFASTAPHTPIVPDKPFQGKSGAGPYGDLAHQVDHTLGEILKAVEKHGLSENTIVIFTSDNGSPQRAGDPHLHGKQAFKPGAVVEMYGHNPSAHWRGMKWKIYEGGHRVPFIVRWPGKVKAGSVCDQTVSGIDLMRTFAAITSYELPADSAEDSYDLSPLLFGKTLDRPLRQATVLSKGGPGSAIRQGKWKYIAAHDKDNKDKNRPPGQLYDLEADPSEQNNLWAERPEVVRRLQALLKSYKSSDRTAPF